jgi:ribosome-binding protein aMBF1 (putative translation factor)
VKFTPEEIEEMRRADEEIERDFRWTNDELAASRRRDADILLSRKSKRGRSIAEYQRAYYEANKDSIAEKQQWIRHKRLNRGYSQYELAEAIGSSQAMISRLESGDVKLETFFAKDDLCAVLGARL